MAFDMRWTGTEILGGQAAAARERTLSKELRELLGEYLKSEDLLELFVLMASEPGRKWNAADVSHELPLEPISASNRLMELYLLGLVSHGPSSGKLSGFQFAPPKRLVPAIADLAALYATHPECLREYLRSLPGPRARSLRPTPTGEAR